MDPFGGAAAVVVFVVVDIVLPAAGRRLAAAGRVADGAETAPARAEAEPRVGFFAAAAAVAVVAEAGRVESGARVAVVVVVWSGDKGNLINQWFDNNKSMPFLFFLYN